MVNYFLILGLPTTATKMDIKSAYRKMAMRYHPDKNKAPGARERFIEVNEAYEFLSDDRLRAQHRMQLTRRISHEDLLKHRERLYRQWVNQQRQKARKRAAANAESSFDKFSKSPIYKTAMVVSNAYNYIFFAIGIFIICSPVLRYYGSSERELIENPITTFDVMVPIVIGIAFTYGIYYFLFKNNPDKPASEKAKSTGN